MIDSTPTVQNLQTLAFMFLSVIYPLKRLFQESLKPLCNLSLDDALELFWLGESHVDWDRLQSVAEGFAKFNGGEELSVDDYRVLIQVQIQRASFDSQLEN